MIKGLQLKGKRKTPSEVEDVKCDKKSNRHNSADVAIRRELEFKTCSLSSPHLYGNDWEEVEACGSSSNPTQLLVVWDQIDIIFVYAG